MGDGWLRNPQDGWTYRFQRDEKSWSVDPRVFVDKGRAMPDGSPALLKTRKHLRRERAEGMWKDLVRKGWEKVPAVWGADAEPWKVFVPTEEFVRIHKTPFIPHTGMHGMKEGGERPSFFYVLKEPFEPAWTEVVRGVTIALNDDKRIRRALQIAQGIDFYRYEVMFNLIPSS